MPGKLKNFKKKGTIKETEGGNFGNYEEELGGGTPRGGGWGGRSGRVGWDQRAAEGELPEGAHREEQPRTADGKFTYNSVNGKGLKYKSRGKTVNPLLTEGENGIKIDEAKEQFKTRSGSIFERFKGKWEPKGAEKVTRTGKNKYIIKVAEEDIVDIAKRGFNVSTGLFKGEEKQWSGQGKKGVHTQAEKQAIKWAKKHNQEAYVTDETGAIKIKGEKSLDQLMKRLQNTKAENRIHTQKQINMVRDMLNKAGKDTSNITDEQIDQLADEYFDFTSGK